MHVRSSHSIIAAALLAACGMAPVPGAAQDPEEPAEMTGVVIDVDGGTGIGDVILRIDGTSVSAASDESGRFVLRGIPAGIWTLRVEHVAYGLHEHVIAVEAGERSSVQIRLAQEAIEMEPLVVEGETSLQRQRRTTGASFWEVDRERIVRAIGTSRADATSAMASSAQGTRRTRNWSIPVTTTCIEKANMTANTLNSVMPIALNRYCQKASVLFVP